MKWSTRELAEIAQTTVNTIRHYHHLGLLDEPERGPNGYKRYGMKDLTRLLQVRRLAGLGVPLAQICKPADDGGGIKDNLRQVDAEVVASIQRLLQVRSDILASLRDEDCAERT